MIVDNSLVLRPIFHKASLVLSTPAGVEKRWIDRGDNGQGQGNVFPGDIMPVRPCLSIISPNVHLRDQGCHCRPLQATHVIGLPRYTHSLVPDSNFPLITCFPPPVSGSRPRYWGLNADP